MKVKASFLSLILGLLLFRAVVADAPLRIDRSRSRNLDSWNPAIRNYSQRHYGEYTYKLKPTCIVLHYTVTEGFPYNLTDTDSFAGETPGLAVHYVVDGNQVWEVLPPTIRSRGCYGINHRAINIEMVAMDADDLSSRRATLETTARLVDKLKSQFSIPSDKIYSHEQVASMDRSKVPEAKDLVDDTSYHKIDPGEKNMMTIRSLLRR